MCDAERLIEEATRKFIRDLSDDDLQELEKDCQKIQDFRKDLNFGNILQFGVEKRKQNP